MQVSVKFRVVNGTAIEHSDFETISDTAVIPDGASSIDLPIRIIDDNLPELEEIFYVELLNQIMKLTMGLPWMAFTNLNSLNFFSTKMDSFLLDPLTTIGCDWSSVKIS